MLIKKLTPNQLDKLKEMCEKLLVHPCNVTPTSSIKKQDEKFKHDYANLLSEFYTLMSPQIVLSLVQTILGENTQTTYDLNGELL